jgi:hypothetical protein
MVCKTNDFSPGSAHAASAYQPAFGMDRVGWSKEGRSQGTVVTVKGL